MHFLHLAYALSSVSLALAWTTYVVPYSKGNDDTPALIAAFAANTNLSRDTTILFKKGVTYNILTPIHFPYFDNVIVSVQGNLTYGADVKATQAIVGSSSYKGAWFSFSGGTNITLEGSRDPQWGWVNSHGQQWWNVMQEKSSKVNRPTGWGFGGITNGEIRYMKLWQPISQSFAISGNDLYIHHNTIIAVSKHKKIVAYNTDGFGVQGKNILLEDNTVYNEDDCLMLGPPSNNIHFRNSYCSGGHGLSMGPFGKGGSVDIQNVLIEGVTMENSLYGARFKSWIGSGGVARNVTWKNITLRKVVIPIFVTQNYWDPLLGSKPQTGDHTFIDTFTFQNFQGTIDDKANYKVVPGTTGKEVVILDLYKGTVKSIVAKSIQTKTVSGAPETVMCDSTVISSDVGFKCWNGPFQLTMVVENRMVEFKTRMTVAFRASCDLATVEVFRTAEHDPPLSSRNPTRNIFTLSEP